MVGTADGVVVGSNLTATIRGTDWDLKRLVTIQAGSETFKDSTPEGIIKHQGLSDHSATIELFISEPDISTLIAYQTRDSSGKFRSGTISLELEAFDGDTTTVSGTGYVSNVTILDSDGQQKIVARLDIEFIGELTVA